MKAPWRDKTGLAKWVAILATTLGIATGLCGLNFVGVLLLVPFGGGNPPVPVTFGEKIHSAIGAILGVAAWVELLVMVVSVVAILILGLVIAVRHIMRRGW